MKNSGEAIQKVLAGLRDADAPDGMERRIMEAVEDRVLARSSTRSRWFRQIWMVTPLAPVAVTSLACSVVVAMVVFALGISGVRRAWQAPTQSEVKVAPVVSKPAGGSEGMAGDVKLRAAGASARSANLRSVGLGARGTAKSRAGATVADGDAVALVEMRAASFPAPPMPLTEQEKLLLRIAHKRDPVQLVALNSAQRAAQNREEKAEVERFFEPNTAGDNE